MIRNNYANYLYLKVATGFHGTTISISFKEWSRNLLYVHFELETHGLCALLLLIKRLGLEFYEQPR